MLSNILRLKVYNLKIIFFIDVIFQRISKRTSVSVFMRLSD